MSTQNTKSTWFVQSNRGELGPFNHSQLQELAARGSLNRTSLLRETRAGNWIRAEQLPSIFGSSPADAASAKPANSSQVDLQQSSQRLGQRPGQSNSPPSLPTGGYTARRTNSSTPVVWIVSGVCAASLLMVLFIFLAVANRKESAPASRQLASGTRAEAAPGSEPASTDFQPAERMPTMVESASHGATFAVPPGRSGPRAETYSTEELVTRSKESVALIATASGGIGSGFVAAQGVVVTNYHVVADCDSKSIEVYFPDGTNGQRGPFHGTLICEEPDRDLALLHIDQAVPSLHIDKEHVFRRGQDVVTIGSPGVFDSHDILPNAVAKGVLSSELEMDSIDHYQLSLAVNPGNSGGPVFGMDGKVIGVVVSKSRSEEAIGFCIPGADLARLLASQEALGFRPTAKADAEHDARVTVRAVCQQTLELVQWFDVVSKRFEEETGNRPETVAAREFIQGMSLYLNKEHPGLVKDYSFELKQIVNNDRLSDRQRAEVHTLQQRHAAIFRLLDRPQSNLPQLTSDLTLLRDQFMQQLAIVNRTLQLGKPHLFQ